MVDFRHTLWDALEPYTVNCAPLPPAPNHDGLPIALVVFSRMIKHVSIINTIEEYTFGFHDCTVVRFMHVDNRYLQRWMKKIFYHETHHQWCAEMMNHNFELSEIPVSRCRAPFKKNRPEISPPRI